MDEKTKSLAGSHSVGLQSSQESYTKQGDTNIPLHETDWWRRVIDNANRMAVDESYRKLLVTMRRSPPDEAENPLWVECHDDSTGSVVWFLREAYEDNQQQQMAKRGLESGIDRFKKVDGMP